VVFVVLSIMIPLVPPLAVKPAVAARLLLKVVGIM
jgi:hypothetical protein